jgi:hypothetical protein
LISSYFFVLHPLSQGLPILPGIFLERESWSQPYQEFLIAPQLDHALKYSIRVWGWGYVKEGLTRSCFHAEILEFQSYSRHKNHFDIDSKQIYSEEIQVIPMERFSEMMKTFYLLLVKNTKWHLVCQKRFKFQFEGYWEPIFKAFILFAWIMI